MTLETRSISVDEGINEDAETRGATGLRSSVRPAHSQASCCACWGCPVVRSPSVEEFDATTQRRRLARMRRDMSMTASRTLQPGVSPRRSRQRELRTAKMSGPTASTSVSSLRADSARR